MNQIYKLISFNKLFQYLTDVIEKAFSYFSAQTSLQIDVVSPCLCPVFTEDRSVLSQKLCSCICTLRQPGAVAKKLNLLKQEVILLGSGMAWITSLICLQKTGEH